MTKQTNETNGNNEVESQQQQHHRQQQQRTEANSAQQHHHQQVVTQAKREQGQSDFRGGGGKVCSPISTSSSSGSKQHQTEIIIPQVVSASNCADYDKLFQQSQTSDRHHYHPQRHQQKAALPAKKPPIQQQRLGEATQFVGSRQSFSIAKLPANMSKSKLNEFREAFRLFDKDGDGSITKEELGRVMRSLGQFAREEELQQMLHDVDIDGDGCFSFEEFVEIVYNMGNTESSTKEEEEKELRDAFRVFDKHNRGYISASDLRAVLQCLGEDLSEEEIEDMIKEVDVDGDGRIDFLEFVHALGEPGEDDDNNEEDRTMEEFEEEEIVGDTLLTA